MKLLACAAVLAVVWLAWPGASVLHAADGRDLSAVNTSVHADDGQTYGTLTTVNGNVRVGRRATADEARTVNGSVTLDDEARVGEVSTVNGGLDIAEGVPTERDARTVNGPIELGRRAHVGGDVATVSGDIEVTGAEIAGVIRTNNGDIDLTEGARVRGGIHVKETKGSGWRWGKDDPIKVHVCSSCVVEGELRFERPVELRVDAGAKIGKVIGDDVRRL